MFNGRPATVRQHLAYFVSYGRKSSISLLLLAEIQMHVRHHSHGHLLDVRGDSTRNHVPTSSRLLSAVFYTGHRLVDIHHGENERL